MNKKAYVKSLLKRATAGTDFLLAASNIYGLPGQIYGYVADTTKDDLKKMQESPVLSAIPGVGAARLIRREIAAPGSSKGRTFMTNTINPAVPALLLGLAGAGLGRALEHYYPETLGKERGLATFLGGVSGLGLGAGASILGTPLGLLAGMNGKKRTKQEHEEAERKYSALRAALDPVYNGYHRGRRLISTNDVDSEE